MAIRIASVEACLCAILFLGLATSGRAFEANTDISIDLSAGSCTAFEVRLLNVQSGPLRHCLVLPSRAHVHTTSSLIVCTSMTHLHPFDVFVKEIYLCTQQVDDLPHKFSYDVELVALLGIRLPQNIR